MIGYRHGDPDRPFLWETNDQPPARWHGPGEGPVHYFADTPDGAWAEFLRHEGITEPADLDGVRRAVWAVELGDVDDLVAVTVDGSVAVGGLDTYEACRAIAAEHRAAGATGLVAPTAALVDGGARGERVDGGLVDGADRDGQVFVLFGERPDLRGWCTGVGRPTDRLLGIVHHFD